MIRDSALHAPPRNAILAGDCAAAMGKLEPASVDFILTDPPYIARYKDRDGRTVRNDCADHWLRPSAREMHRLLKPHAFAISFYGWPKADLFMRAWKEAGFRIGGHIVFRKRYASNAAFLEYRHEAAYLLVKGNPAYPLQPLPDVMDWVYTGNKRHPTQKSVHILKPLIEAFTKPGDLVLDPFAGSGSTCVAALRCGRDYLGIEIDAGHCEAARARLASAQNRFTQTAKGCAP